MAITEETMLILSKPRRYELRSFDVSHGVMIFVGVETNGSQPRIEVLFSGTEFVRVPQTIGSAVIRLGDDEDIRQLADLFLPRTSGQILFAMVGDKQLFYIVAAGCIVKDL